MRSLVPFVFFAAISVAAAESTDSGARAIDQIPEALRLISTADEVYVFPVTLVQKPGAHGGFSVTPRGHYKHPRRLNAEASQKLKRLLGKESNWLHVNDSTVSVDAPPRSVGFIFRKGKDKLVLLHGLGARLQGTFNDEHVGGSLEFEKAEPQLNDWTKIFAKPELSIKRPNQSLEPTAGRRDAHI